MDNRKVVAGEGSGVLSNGHRPVEIDLAPDETQAQPADEAALAAAAPLLNGLHHTNGAAASNGHHVQPSENGTHAAEASAEVIRHPNGVPIGEKAIRRRMRHAKKQPKAFDREDMAATFRDVVIVTVEDARGHFKRGFLFCPDGKKQCQLVGDALSIIEREAENILPTDMKRPVAGVFSLQPWNKGVHGRGKGISVMECRDHDAFVNMMEAVEYAAPLMARLHVREDEQHVLATRLMEFSEAGRDNREAVFERQLTRFVQPDVTPPEYEDDAPSAKKFRKPRFSRNGDHVSSAPRLPEPVTEEMRLYVEARAPYGAASAMAPAAPAPAPAVAEPHAPPGELADYVDAVKAHGAFSARALSHAKPEHGLNAAGAFVAKIADEKTSRLPDRPFTLCISKSSNKDPEKVKRAVLELLPPAKPDQPHKIQFLSPPPHSGMQGYHLVAMTAGQAFVISRALGIKHLGEQPLQFRECMEKVYPSAQAPAPVKAGEATIAPHGAFIAQIQHVSPSGDRPYLLCLKRMHNRYDNEIGQALSAMLPHSFKDAGKIPFVAAYEHYMLDKYRFVSLTLGEAMVVKDKLNIPYLGSEPLTIESCMMQLKQRQDAVAAARQH